MKKGSKIQNLEFQVEPNFFVWHHFPFKYLDMQKMSLLFASHVLKGGVTLANIKLGAKHVRIQFLCHGQMKPGQKRLRTGSNLFFPTVPNHSFAKGK